MDMESILKMFDCVNNTDLDKDCNTEESQTQIQQKEKASCQPAFFEESPSTTATPNVSNLLKQNTIHEAPLPYHEAIKQQQVKSAGTQLSSAEYLILMIRSLMIDFAVVSAYPEHPDEERGRAATQLPPDGQLAPMVGENAAGLGRSKHIVRNAW